MESEAGQTLTFAVTAHRMTKAPGLWRPCLYRSTFRKTKQAILRALTAPVRLSKDSSARSSSSRPAPLAVHGALTSLYPLLRSKCWRHASPTS